MDNIKKGSTSDLIPDDKNFNKHTEAGKKMLRKSLKELGFGRSILVDKNNRIIGGNGVCEAAEKANTIVVETTGDELVVVKRTDIDLDSKKGRTMALADNSTAAADLQWDMDLIAEAEDTWGICLEDWGLGLSGESTGGDYTMKIETPTYEPTGEKVEAGDCYDTTKADELLLDIETCQDLEPETRDMLKAAALRFTRFNFDKVAEYYSQCTNERIRDLMEKMALVIIDYDKAIEYGFVQLQQYLIDERTEEYENEI